VYPSFFFLRTINLRALAFWGLKDGSQKIWRVSAKKPELSGGQVLSNGIKNKLNETARNILCKNISPSQ
jgi:hypothetical protein